MDGSVDGEESVDGLGHALQCAMHALNSGANPEMVAACLLHDVGRAPAMHPSYRSAKNHERVGALWLGPRASEKVAWLVAAHVPAKVYLAASDPSYLKTLSPESVSSFERQRQEVDADLTPWVSHPWWPEALQLRQWDDAAKVPGAATPTVDEVLSELGVRPRRKTPAPPGTPLVG